MTRPSLSGIIPFIALLISFQSLQAQGLFEVSTGAGLFDGGFLKMKYGSKTQVGLSQDLLSQLHTTGLEVCYRFSRKGETGSAGPFYIMCGAGTTLFGTGYDAFEQSFIYPRIGRSFFFSRKISKAGLNADLGITVHRYTNPPEGHITEIIPFSGSLGVFYRF
jgi:hypothetical protein